MTLRVQDQSPAVVAMEVDWAVCEALMGGTKAMREAKGDYLPAWPHEEPASYAARLATATLFPAYRRTVSVMAGKPFSKALTFGKDVPQTIQDLCEDVDLQGRNLHVFAADGFNRAMAFGFAGILVDTPKVVRPNPDRPITQAEEQALGVRPYFVLIRHSQIVGWRVEMRGGVQRLVQLRIAETAEEPDGPYGTKCVKRIRVLEPGRFEVWQETEKPEVYAVTAEVGTTTLSEIPFVPCYGWREAFMVSRPPLLDLAYLNVAHWQSSSDQQTILHVARVPILVATGMQDTDVWSFTVGASAAMKMPFGSELKYVEHTGAAIDAGRVSLQDLEQQMIQAGAELLVKKPGDRSATEAANDAEGNKSDLQRIVESFEDSLDQALQFMAEWMRLPEGGHVTLFKDFGAASLGEASGQLVLAMQQQRLIQRPTAIRELQRRGELDAGIDPEKELAAVEMEGPSLGEMLEPEPKPVGVD